MENKCYIALPPFPNFVEIGLEGTIHLSTFDIADFTLEEAKAIAELIRRKFIEHYEKEKHKRKP